MMHRAICLWLGLLILPAQASEFARRLNRYEYRTTIRDLLGVDFEAGDAFPADNFSYGFDNNAETLTVTPALVAKYLDAAGKIARAAVEPVPPPATPQLERHSNTGDSPEIIWQRNFVWDGEYDIHIAIAGRNDPFALKISLDGRDPQPLDLAFDFEGRRYANTRLYIPAGNHRLRISAVRDEERALDQAVAYEGLRARQSGGAPASRSEIQARMLAGSLPDSKGATAPPFPEYVEARGPSGLVMPAIPAGYHLIFVCGHAPGQHTAACVRQDLANLARRAWRRPVAASEIDRLMQLAAAEPDIERQMETGITAILVSPSFLFRIESPVSPEARQYALASRLSYFLWSSMPDEALFHAAETGQLEDPGVLASQARRMLADPKSKALAENFAAQWLEFRNLDSIQRDPVQFPEFTPALRDSMRQETELFVENMLHTNRSILDFLNARYTFVNGLLAKAYGIRGVEGDEFRRVDLSGTGRAGILTQASVLTVTSYATRTSPVLRGKWILENILDDPPPPPPVNVAALRDPSTEPGLTLRQQLEQHRSNPACASCHARMDVLGFGLENFDAIGRWRTRDGSLPVDSTGTLPDGLRFSSPAELAATLTSHPDAFARCLTEKLLTFALGRGLGTGDRAAAVEISQSAAKGNYAFTDLIVGIVESPLFRKFGGENE